MKLFSVPSAPYSPLVVDYVFNVRDESMNLCYLIKSLMKASLVSYVVIMIGIRAQLSSQPLYTETPFIR